MTIKWKPVAETYGDGQDAERQRQTLQKAVTAMEKVLGVVGHELRTPLAALRATAELLMTDCRRCPEQLDTFLKLIHDETIRMADLVNNMLEAARLNSGCVRWNWGPVTLAPLCDDALKMFRPLIDPGRLALSCQVSPDDLEMQGDADALRRLLINLVSNAVKHTEAGSIHVSVSSVNVAPNRPDRYTLDAGPWLHLEVRDTGRGIDAAVAASLGKPFVLNSGTIGDDYVHGSGLGLAICKGIVAAHGGSIDVTSRPGRGCTFNVYLRADQAGPVESIVELSIHQEQVA